MNREILFRGKRLENGEWVFGDLLQVKYSNGYYRASIVEQTPVASNFPVEPETVGQYTGLKDKNGVKIFEGDIVGAFLRTQIFEVKWCAERGGYFLDDVDCCGGYEPSTECLGNMLHTIEVIGNIHDNPELLEVLGDE